MAIRAISGGSGKIRHPGRIVPGDGGEPPPPGPTTFLLIHADENFSDSSGQNIPATVAGATPTINTSDYKFGPGSGQGPAGSPRLGIYYGEASPEIWQNWTSFCIDFWIYWDGNIAEPLGNAVLGCYNIDIPGPPYQSQIFSIYPSVAGSDPDFSLGINGSFYSYIEDDYEVALDVGSPIDQELMPVETWNHVALTYDGTTLRLFINGVLVDSDNSAVLPSAVLFPGYFIAGADGYGVGMTTHLMMDELRVVKNDPVWISNFTPPSSPYPNG
jgi:hypothetical protein